jgi:hypothetical protein
MAACYRAKIVTSDGLRRCFEARLTREGEQDLVARFGGIALRQDRRAVITDPGPVPVRLPRQELLLRLRRRYRELCDKGATVAVHQVAGLKQLGIPGPGQPAWAVLMAKMRRNGRRQQHVAARIFSAIKADGRLNAVYVDDMQHVVEMTEPSLDRPG